MDPSAIYPAPEGYEESEALEPGPWMPRDTTPAREGMYLRQFDEGEAFSWWRDGEWHADNFWDSPSDLQEQPWRGGVLREGRTDADWQQEQSP